MPRRFLRDIRTVWGWLTPLFFVFLILGPIIWLFTDGALRTAGLPLFIVGVIGLLVTREGRLRLYFFVPKAGRFKSEYAHAVEAERQKRALVAQGIPALINWLYHDYMVHYPNWIHDRDNYYVPSLITQAHQKRDDTLEITIGENTYSIKFVQYGYRTPEGEKDTEALLEIFTPRFKLFAMKLVPSIVQRTGGGRHSYEKHWRPISVQYAQAGEWVKDFQRLGEKVLQEIKGRKREDRLD